MTSRQEGQIVGEKLTTTLPLPADGVQLVTFIPWRLVRRRGARKEVITPLDAPETFVEEAKQEHNARNIQQVSSLQRAFGLAYHWQRLLDAQSVSSAKEIADAEDLDVTYVRRLLRLVLLAPDIIESLLRCQQASLAQMRSPWSSLWAKQRQQLKQRDTHV